MLGDSVSCCPFLSLIWPQVCAHTPAATQGAIHEHPNRGANTSTLGVSVALQIGAPWVVFSPCFSTRNQEKLSVRCCLDAPRSTTWMSCGHRLAEAYNIFGYVFVISVHGPTEASIKPSVPKLSGGQLVTSILGTCTRASGYRNVRCILFLKVTMAGRLV